MKNGPYELVVAPAWYTGKKYRGRYVYKHRLVAAQKIGRPLRSDEVAHHKNEQKMDNSRRNIEMKTNVAHSREHKKPAARSSLLCPVCKAVFSLLQRTMRMKRKKGQNRFYCSRQCGGRSRKKFLDLD